MAQLDVVYPRIEAALTTVAHEIEIAEAEAETFLAFQSQLRRLEPVETSSYGDPHGDAARSVLDRADDLTAQSVSLDEEFPLDDGENAAVTLAKTSKLNCSSVTGSIAWD